MLVVLMLGFPGCRRAEDPDEMRSAAEPSASPLERAEQSSPVGPPEDPEPIDRRPEGSYLTDPEDERILEEIAALSGKIEVLEPKLTEQNALIDTFLPLLSPTSEIPDEVARLMSERDSTERRIQTLDDRRRALIKEAELRRRQALDK